MQQIKGESTINKLIILFVFDKMESPISKETICDMCCVSNSWISYMDLEPLLDGLLESSFIYNANKNENQKGVLYAITSAGRECLAQFYVKIPVSIRDEIVVFVKNNRLNYKRKQECNADYFMNKDGSYTVVLQISEPTQTVFDLKFIVPTKQAAKRIYKKWEEMASTVYENIYELLVD